MADPATLWPGYGIPAEQTPARSAEIRNAFEAIARTFLSTDPNQPLNPRDGQIRAFLDTLGNHKLQYRLSGGWHTFLQNIQSGIPAPAKLVLANFAAAASNPWVVDHNLGSKPMAQVFDISFNLLQGVPLLGEVEQLFLGTIPAPVMTSLPVGPATTTIRNALPLDFRGIFLDAFVAQQEVVLGAPVGQLEFELSGGGGPMVGGEVPIPSGGSLGDVSSGAPATGNNTFEAGDTLELKANMTTLPTAGALEVYARVRRETQASQYRLQHINDDRLIITHPAPTVGFVILVG